MVRKAREGEIDYHTIDRFTVAHFAVGAVMGLARAPWWAAVASAVAWELIEDPLKKAHPQMFHQPTLDTPENAVVDAAAWVLGWGVFYRLTDRYPLFEAEPKVKG